MVLARCGCVGSVDGVHNEAVSDVRCDGVPCVWTSRQWNTEGISECPHPRRELLTAGRGGLEAGTGRTTVDLGGQVPAC